MYCIYVLQAEKDEKFYLGYSADLKKRVKSHNSGQSKSTRYSRWRLVYYEAYQSKIYAKRRESSLKRNERMRSFLYNRIKESLNAE